MQEGSWLASAQWVECRRKQALVHSIAPRCLTNFLTYIRAHDGEFLSGLTVQMAFDTYHSYRSLFPLLIFKRFQDTLS